jgi:uncharacterized membrane-anchored protein YitT (DUF2179 family)
MMLCDGGFDYMKLAWHARAGSGRHWLAGWPREVFFLVSGSLLAAFAVNVFYVPMRLTMGGVSGIVSIIYQMTGQGDFLPFGVLLMLCNIPLLLLGWRTIDLRFVWRSLAGTLIYSIFIDLTEPFLNHFFWTWINRPLGNGDADPLIFCLFGGVIYGAGLGLVFRGGYTTGGTDILAMVFRKKTALLSVGQFIMVMDALIVLSSVVAYRDESGPGLLLAMYSFIAMFVTSKSIDILLEGFDYCRAATIISDHSDRIAARILQELKRGVTSLQGKGLYTGRDKHVLLCVLSRRQVPQIKRIVEEIDPDAFVIVTEAREVMGEGFGSAIQF